MMLSNRFSYLTDQWQYPSHNIIITMFQWSVTVTVILLFFEQPYLHSCLLTCLYNPIWSLHFWRCFHFHLWHIINIELFSQFLIQISFYNASESCDLIPSTVQKKLACWFKTWVVMWQQWTLVCSDNFVRKECNLCKQLEL